MSRMQEAQDAALKWIIAREDGDWCDADQSELDAWLQESDFNRIVFLRLEHSWRESDRIASLGPGLAPSIPTHAPRWRGGAPRWIFAVAASLAAVMGLSWVGYQQAYAPRIAPASYGTGVGGHRMVGLPDGSRVELNTSSAVQAIVDGERREVWLQRGEAYFEVAHDATRPFVVHVGKRAVTVLGTKFSIRRQGDDVSVSVVEGRVRVDEVERGQAVRSTIITGGDVALARGTATLVTARSADRVENILAWRQGMLNFDGATLKEVAAEFNRYNERRLSITDPAAASIRIGGTFPAKDPEAFARLLQSAYGLKLEETADAIKVSN
ncbi:MAG TPA: FecR domain-containing protein [Novosphingobium sp.]|nr:FecR domain-containing protein [Novosphingobium sp.]